MQNTCHPERTEGYLVDLLSFISFNFSLLKNAAEVGESTGGRGSVPGHPAKWNPKQTGTEPRPPVLFDFFN